MTVTYDPSHPAYFDEADYRAEVTRVFDACHGCRLCWNLCPSFQSLFDIIDSEHDGKPEALTPREQDRIVDECYQCKLCYVKCPYVPPHEWQLDFPRLMLRGAAVRWQQRGGGLADQALARTDLLGRVGSAVAPLANALLGSPNSPARRALEKVAGVAAARQLPAYAGQRFSAWARRYLGGRAQRADNGDVALFQTCMVEYQNTGLGKDALRVLERNRIACAVPPNTVCCGMPWLDMGNLAAFRKQAAQNLAALAPYVRQGKDVVVLQPTCAYALRHEYPAYLKTDEAKLVAAHTYDVSEYLMNVHRAAGKGLDTAFTGTVPEAVTWHVPCHLKAQNVGFKSRDLLRLTGAQVTVVDKCAGIDGSWGLRARNYALAKKVAAPLGNGVRKAGHACVAGDCTLANGVIAEETGHRALHPVQVLARAYGIPEEA